MGVAKNATRSKVVTTTAAIIAIVLLTGAQRSCELSRSSTTSGSSANSESRTKSASNGSTAKSTSVVQYSVTSDASIHSVTYVSSGGDKVTRADVGSSWSGSGPASGRVMVSATAGSGSWIKCSVKLNKKVVQRASAVGGGSMTVVCDATF